ncbi:MAG: hypothetical protein WC655_16985, partial [Candidatus Hydrogenedentales bacterium]
MRQGVIRFAMLALLGSYFAHPDTAIDLGTARLLIDSKGYATLDFSPADVKWPKSDQPIVGIDSPEGYLTPESVTRNGDTLLANFAGGHSCTFSVKAGDGFAVFDLIQLDAPKETTRMNLFSLAVPRDAEIMSNVN